MDLDRWMLIGEAPAAPGKISVPTLSGSAAPVHRPAGSALASGDGQQTGTQVLLFSLCLPIGGV
jgi:hypothetical protein